MTSYSPNMLKTYQACPRKYYFKFVEKLNVPVSFLKFEKGKKIHALANYYLQDVNISRIEKALTPEELAIWQSLLMNPYFQKTCYKSEYSLSTKLQNYWIGGRLDALMKDDKGYYILDYKTGSVPKNPEYDYQTMTYLLCLDSLLEGKFQISFVYIDLKNVKNHVIEFNSTLKSEYEKKLVEICSLIEKDSDFNCNLEGCKFCEYSNLCPKE